MNLIEERIRRIEPIFEDDPTVGWLAHWGLFSKLGDAPLVRYRGMISFGSDQLFRHVRTIIDDVMVMSVKPVGSGERRIVVGINDAADQLVLMVTRVAKQIARAEAQRKREYVEPHQRFIERMEALIEKQRSELVGGGR